MAKNEVFAKIEELNAKINELPKGYISQKNINGKAYFYHQWSENGTKKSKYLRDDEIKPLSDLIELRKKLQSEIKSLRTKGKENAIRNEVTHMKCTLMHKRIAVAELELDDATGFIQKIGTVYEQKHMPVGIPVRKGITDRTALNEWWTDRSIPASRSGVREALETLEITSTKMLLVRCYGLSLSDQYWIKPEGTNLTWDELNFFNNGFSDDIGDVLFGANKKVNGLDLSSPDNTSDGNLKKRWKIIDGKRCLVKGGSNPFRQQPFNEVIAAGIMERLSIPHVPYTVMWNKGAPYSVCEDFVDENTELIPAWRIIQIKQKDNSTSMYRHFINCCDELGIKGVREFLDQMLILDYIIGNEDRHLNNFGALRNAETLEWIGMAPIYDSGSSLGYDKLPAQMYSEDAYECKPFKKHHSSQIQLVTSFDKIDFTKLADVEELIRSTFSSEEAKKYIDDSRIEAIAKSTMKRIEKLEGLAMTQKNDQDISTDDDVEENIAEDYSPKMSM